MSNYIILYNNRNKTPIIKFGLRKGTKSDFQSTIVKMFCEDVKMVCIFEESNAVDYLINRNGTWQGLLPLIVNGTHDVSRPGLTMTYERMLVVDFTHPVFYPNLLFITRIPTDKKIKFGIF